MEFDLSIVIPCYYNELNIPDLAEELLRVEKESLKDLSIQYVLVNDGSKDDTYKEIKNFKSKMPNRVVAVDLVRNVGSYNAILAGLSEADGEAIVVISADLQDPPALIPKMYEHYLKGFKLVIANRDKRNDPWSSSFFSNLYHNLIRKFALPNLPQGGFDFALFHKNLKDHLLQMDEKNTNCLYMLLWFGYEYVSVPYERKEREKGESMWTVKKKIKLFIDSFVSFSFLPIRYMTYSGVFLAIIGFIYAFAIVCLRLLGKISIEGWTATMLVIIGVASIQMIFMGIIGEYLWRIFDELRKRPNYIKEEVLKDGKE